MARAREAIRVLFPGDFAAFMGAYGGEDLVIFAWEYVDTVFFGCYGPTGYVFGNNFPG